MAKRELYQGKVRHHRHDGGQWRKMMSNMNKSQGQQKVKGYQDKIIPNK